MSIGSDRMYDRYKNIPDVYIGGKKYRLCDVYKYFDVGDSTVRKRYYKQKLRGWELVYGKGKVPVEIEQGKGISEWQKTLKSNNQKSEITFGLDDQKAFSTTGIVRELHFNGGKPYAVVEVGKHNFNISNRYEIARVGANDDEMQR